MLPVVGVLAGILIGLFFPVSMPVEYSRSCEVLLPSLSQGRPLALNGVPQGAKTCAT